MSSPASNKPVVVGLDSSEQALRALDWAVGECCAREVALRIVTVVSYRVQREALQRLAETAVKRVQDLAPELDVSSELRWGHPDEELVEVSGEARVVVLGSRGMGGFQGLLLGSVSTVVAAQAHCPVAVVRGRALDEIALRHAPVVVGVAGGPPDEPTLEFALEEAVVRGVDLVAVHTWRASEAEHAEAASAPLLDRDNVQEREQRMLAEILAGVRERYPDVSVEQVVHRGHPVAALTAEGESAQLIVVGNRRRTKFPALRLGSVTNGVLHHAPCPVVVVRAEDQG